MNIKNYLFILLIIIISIACANCNSSRQETTVKKTIKSISGIALEKFGKDHKVIKNQSETYAICLHTMKKSKPPVMNNQNYFVYDFKEKEIIFEDKIVNGNVFWESDSLVTASRIPGIVKRDSENITGHKIYSFNVFLKKKIYN
jgi:hypothetical protein